MKKISAFTMMEVLGVVGVVLVLAAVAIPSYKSTNQGAKVSVALRNMSTLNDAVQQYDEAGGLMTAEVIVPANVGALTNKADLPEMKVLNRLRDAGRTETGEVVSSWQEPIFDTKGNRVVWVNGLSQAEANQTTKTISGMRNPVAEAKMKSGQGGMFTMIGPDAGRMGIVGFVENNLTVAGTPTPTPTPAVTMYSVSLSLSSPAAGAITGNGSYKAGSTANISVILNPGWKVGSWDAATTQLLGSSKSTKGSFAVTGNVTGTLTVERADVTVNLSVSPLSAGTVTGGGNYKYGANVPYTLTVNPGWAFKSWSRAGMAQNGTINNVMSDINATATMQLVDYILTMQSAQGGSANLAPGAYKYKLNDEVPLVATPIWSTTWNSPRYRWDKWTVGTTTQTNSAFTHVMTAPVIIKPNFIQQYRYEYVEPPVNGHMGTAASDKPNGIYDMGTQIKLTSTVAPENKTKYRLKQWLQSTDAGGTTWSPLNSSANYTHTLSTDIRIKAEFTDKVNVSAKILDENGQPAPTAVTLTGLSATKPVELTMSQVASFTVTPTAGWLFVSTDAPSFKPNSNPKTGGSGSFTPITDTVVTFNVRRRPIVTYWNSNAGRNRGGLYTPSYVAVAGTDFRAIQRLKGVNVAAYLGNVNYNVDGGTQLTGSWDQYHTFPNMGATAAAKKYGYHFGVTYHKTYTTYAYYYARSACSVALDAETGDFAGQLGWGVGQGVGAIVANVGRVVGIAYGYDSVGLTPTGSYKTQSSSYNSSPIVIDLNNNGILDSFSREWKRLPDRKVSTDNLVKFKMDGKTTGQWEWITNQDGLLVYNPERASELTVTGENLFGNWSFGKLWKNGYEALASLDKNQSGNIDQEEIHDLYIWKDENSNAICESGELLACKDYGIVSIGYAASLDEYGNADAPASVEVHAKDGTVWAFNSWDWISYGLSADVTLFKEAIFNESLSYLLSGDGFIENSNITIGKFEGKGMCVAVCLQPLTTTDLAFPFKREGNSISWEGTAMVGGVELPIQGKINLNGMELSGELIIDGKTYPITGKSLGLTWEAFDTVQSKQAISTF